MKKYRALIIILAILAAIGLLLLFGRLSQDKGPRGEMLLFYGATCPHCKNVEKFIVDNDVHAKLSFRELEVYNDKANAALMAKTAKACGLEATRGLGVPFFYDGRNCLSGDQDIINFLQSKIQ